jgi:hypothetical protein
MNPGDRPLAHTGPGVQDPVHRGQADAGGLGDVMDEAMAPLPRRSRLIDRCRGESCGQRCDHQARGLEAEGGPALRLCPDCPLPPRRRCHRREPVAGAARRVRQRHVLGLVRPAGGRRGHAGQYAALLSAGLPDVLGAGPAPASRDRARGSELRSPVRSPLARLPRAGCQARPATTGPKSTPADGLKTARRPGDGRRAPASPLPERRSRSPVRHL